MTLTKIPFILLMTWGIHMTYSQPNPTPPQDERFPSSLAVPLENSGYFEWIPFISRVSIPKIFYQRNSIRDPRIGPTIRCLHC